jgi:hypothetical protein
MAKHFSASLDTVSKIITGLVGPIFTLFPLYFFISLRNHPDKAYMPYYIGIIIFLWIAFAFCFLYWVKGYTIENGQLIIHRRIGDKMYDLQNFKSAESITKLEMGFVIRILGNGGVFGYTGFFTSKKHGRMQWFVTSQEKLMIIEMRDGKYICISPDDGAGFVKALGFKG